MSPAPDLAAEVEANLFTFDLTTLASVAQGPAAGAPISGVKAVAITFKADAGNSTQVYIGGAGTPTFKLEAGTSETLDLPVGYFFDLSKLSCSGAGGTSGLIIHVAAFIVP